MTVFESGLYAGQVTHQRFTPKRHRLRYAMFQVLFDLDEIPRLAQGLRLISHNRFNLFSFHDRDHGAGRHGALRAYVEETLAGAGIALDGGKVRLLCMPRVLGHVFNPLSIYFCHRRDGALAAMLYEVNNTFGERHSYLIAAPQTAGDIRQSCAKAFHVSPFMAMEMSYHFTVTPPGDSLATTVLARDAGGAAVIVATFRGQRREMSDRALLRLLVAYPLLTLKVVAAIHFEAFKLILKGVRLRPRPPPPADQVTVVADTGFVSRRAAGRFT